MGWAGTETLCPSSGMEVPEESGGKSEETYLERMIGAGF